MTRYIEPTLRTRQLFFLAAILWFGLVLLATHLDQLLPPLSNDVTIALDQALGRAFLAAVFFTVFLVALSVVAIHYTRRAVQSRQWPPVGMSVPFKTKVKDIKNPRSAWLYLAALLTIIAIQVALPWVSYSKQKTLFKELKEQIEAAAQQGVPADGFAAAELER